MTWEWERHMMFPKQQHHVSAVRVGVLFVVSVLSLWCFKVHLQVIICLSVNDDQLMEMSYLCPVNAVPGSNPVFILTDLHWSSHCVCAFMWSLSKKYSNYPELARVGYERQLSHHQYCCCHSDHGCQIWYRDVITILVTMEMKCAPVKGTPWHSQLTGLDEAFRGMRLLQSDVILLAAAHWTSWILLNPH